MLKRILCTWLNLSPKEDLWRMEKDLGNQLVELHTLTSRNFQLNVEKHTLEKENQALRTQAEEAVKDLALLTGEVLSLKNQLAYAKAELSMKHYE